jgi:hypothetical protein
MDHASDLSYMYHHTALASEETVKRKDAFDTYVKAHGMNVKYRKENWFLQRRATTLLYSMPK